MQMRRALGVGLWALGGFVLAASCTTPPPPRPETATAPAAVSAAALEDHEGDSTDTAVTVPADAQDEARFENDWIYDRIGRFRRISQGTGTLNDRRYDVIEVETPAGDHKKFYFDITDNWKRWQPPPPQ